MFAGCFRNARSVANAALNLVGGKLVGVVSAGERWPDASFRPAIEDLLGAGAILDALGLPLSPEARVARDAWRSVGADLGSVVRASVSGRELTERGYASDVEWALALNTSQVAPLLHEGAFRAAQVKAPLSL